MTPILKEYILVIVPPDAKFRENSSDMRATICCNYNAVKILVALVQSLYASLTLYKTRGDQLTEFGYAAFGLTVTPYAFMSVVNLLSGLLCPEYSTLYLVESDTMRRAQDQGTWHFSGTVGALAPGYEEKMYDRPKSHIISLVRAFCWPLFLSQSLALFQSFKMVVALIRKGHGC